MENIPDSFRKILVTQDNVPLIQDEKVIFTINVLDFLLDRTRLKI